MRKKGLQHQLQQSRLFSPLFSPLKEVVEHGSPRQHSVVSAFSNWFEGNEGDKPHK
jgi:hypothetical protein